MGIDKPKGMQADRQTAHNGGTRRDPGVLVPVKGSEGERDKVVSPPTRDKCVDSLSDDLYGRSLGMFAWMRGVSG